MKTRIDDKECFTEKHIFEILKLCKNSQNKVFSKGKSIILQDKKPDGVYYIKSGTVKIFREERNNHKQIARFVTEGDFIGIKSLMLDCLHIFSAESMTNVVTCFIPKTNFKELLYKSPEIGLYLINCLSSSIQETEARNISLVQKTEQERLAEALIEISTKFKTNEIQLLKRDLSSFAHIKPDDLNKYLRLFDKKNMISFNSQRIKILDIDKLNMQANLVA